MIVIKILFKKLCHFIHSFIHPFHSFNCVNTKRNVGNQKKKFRMTHPKKPKRERLKKRQKVSIAHCFLCMFLCDAFAIYIILYVCLKSVWITFIHWIKWNEWMDIVSNSLTAGCITILSALFCYDFHWASQDLKSVFCLL